MPPAPRTCRCRWSVVHRCNCVLPWTACRGRQAVPLRTPIRVTVILARRESSKKIRSAASACKYVYSLPLQVACLTVRMRTVWMTGSIIPFFCHGCGKQSWQLNWRRSKISNLYFKIWYVMVWDDNTELQVRRLFIHLINLIPHVCLQLCVIVHT